MRLFRFPVPNWRGFFMAIIMKLWFSDLQCSRFIMYHFKFMLESYCSVTTESFSEFFKRSCSYSFHLFYIVSTVFIYCFYLRPIFFFWCPVFFGSQMNTLLTMIFWCVILRSRAYLPFYYPVVILCLAFRAKTKYWWCCCHSTHKKEFLNAFMLAVFSCFLFILCLCFLI